MAVNLLGILGQVMMGLALATLVFERTGSPALSAFSIFGPALASAVGAATLISAGDRLPPRAATVALALATAATTAGFAVPSIPTAAIMVLVLIAGLLGSVGGSVRWGLLTDVVPEEAYVLGRSLMQMSTSAVLVVGNSVTALLLLAMSSNWVLIAAASIHVLAAMLAAACFARRRPRATGRPSIAATWKINRTLWRTSGLPAIYLALWVPNGLIVGAEALFVPYAGEAAGVLFATVAAGMIVGDIIVARFISTRTRQRLITPLRLLLATPFLVFVLQPPTVVAMPLVLAAALGFSAGLILQERLVGCTRPEIRGQALGLHSSGMFAFQGLGALLAGGLAELFAPSYAMTIVAVLCVIVTIALTRPLRSSESVVLATNTAATR